MTFKLNISQLYDDDDDDADDDDVDDDVDDESFL